jgi:hypothetical protein
MNVNCIKSVCFVSNDFRKEIVFDVKSNAIEIPYSEDFTQNSFTIQIEFNSEINQIRLPDYTWGNTKQSRIIPQFCNQIIRLKNGLYLQSETPIAIWEIDKNKTNILHWKFNPEGANQITRYQGDKNLKKTHNANYIFPKNKTLKLLFSFDGAIEISRSKIPFSAIACFTDHCDFDTLDLVQKQRKFFEENGIQVTKGFFLNHFSKREDNASWQKDHQELHKWIADGHELAYHSLSQSLKSKEESFQDFFNFTPPIDVPTWIDHGYQKYNLSLYQKNGISDKDFSENLKKKDIRILWNYIDSGTATSGVINQLNANDFTLGSFLKGIRKKPFKKKMALMIKNSIYHFYGDEKLISNYSQLASSFKKVSKTKSIMDFYGFLKKCVNVFVPLFKIGLLWNSYKNRVYPLAKYGSVFFEHAIENEKLIIFQTLELLDFIEALDKKSIDKLIYEKGIFIGHTYFAVPMDYHDGRIFTSEGKINPKVEENFAYLGEKIKEEQIWNPTLVALVAYWEKFQNVTFDMDENNKIVVTNNSEIPYREIA